MSAPGTQSDGDVIDVTPSAVPAVMAPAFVPVVAPASQPAAKPQRLTLALGVRMANGVDLNLGEATLEEFATLIQIRGGSGFGANQHTSITSTNSQPLIRSDVIAQLTPLRLPR
jgi:hypothetical protein